MVVKCGQLVLHILIRSVLHGKFLYSSSQNLQLAIYSTRHQWFLGTLMNQPHISYQLQTRCICFLLDMKNSQNEIVLTCFRDALNANTPIWHNIAFLRNTFGIDIDSNEITPFINLPSMYLTNNSLCYCLP